jgi:hypothetical protein
LTAIDVRTIGIYILTVIAVASLFQVIAALLTWISETMPANISISPHASNFHMEEDKRYDDRHVVMWYDFFGTVLVKNNEPVELTDCYASLKPPKNTTRQHKDPWLGKQLTWRKNGDCKVSRGAYGGEEVLVLCQMREHSNKKGPSLYEHYFTFCGEKTVWLVNSNDLTFEVELEIHGKLGNKDVRSPVFKCVVEILPSVNADDKVRIKAR